MKKLSNKPEEQRFIIDKRFLKPGDIILTADNTIPSKGIRVATLGRYSHAALWTGGTLIEATLKGVFSKNVDRLIVSQKNHLAVYRCVNTPTDEMLNSVIRYASNKSGTLYSLPDAALMLPARALQWNRTSGEFCSRLVATAYAQAGFDLKNLRSPEFCSPRQLSLCKAFDKVEQCNGKEMVRTASQKELLFAATEDPNLKHLEDTFLWLGKVRELVASRPELKTEFDIQSIDTVEKLILAHQELGAVVVGFIKTTGFLEQYKIDREKNPYRYSFTQMVKKVRLSPLSATKMVFLEWQLLLKMTSKYLPLLLQYYELTRSTRNDYFREMCLLYRNILGEFLDMAEAVAWGFDKLCITHGFECAKLLRQKIEENLKLADAYLGVNSGEI